MLDYALRQAIDGREKELVTQLRRLQSRHKGPVSLAIIGQFQKDFSSRKRYGQTMHFCLR